MPSLADDAGLRVAVLVPCHDEELSVAKVVGDFQNFLPGCTVYVYDNCSTDGTARVAKEAGAIVRSEPRPGKGHVVQRMLADIDSDVYVLVDGDDTYDAASAPAMVDQLVHDHLDMVVGVRVPTGAAAHRRGHTTGNRMFNLVHRRLFGPGCHDVFSGYRVLSRRLAKTFPAASSGFEIEAELTAHALDVGAAMGERDTPFSARADGSDSKLHTFRDGTRILLRSLLHFKELHPFRLFAIIGLLLTAIALALGIPIVVEYFDSRTVPRLPTAIASVGLQVIAVIAFTCGIILDSVARGRREIKRLAYLRMDGTDRHPAR